MTFVTTQLVAGQPIWAKLFYLVRTGHPQEAIDEASRYQQAIDHREPSFLANFKTWLESPDRKYVPKLLYGFNRSLALQAAKITQGPSPIDIQWSHASFFDN